MKDRPEVDEPRFDAERQDLGPIQQDSNSPFLRRFKFVLQEVVVKNTCQDE